MLDESFPTYCLQASNEDPLQTTLYFTYNGSDPSREYVLKRPPPANSKSQYALALFDAHNPSIIYGEVLVQPEWQQPTLSAAEIRANNSPPPHVPVVPENFSVMLYNPDQEVVIRRQAGSWNRADVWGFEIPERTFKLPSSSRLDQETGSNEVSEISPKIVFHWKKDGRLSKDMTCFISGRSLGGKKNKEPDITVAMFKARKHEDLVSIYEPNMARVEVEDRKGLEVVLLLSSVVVQDLYLNPRQDPFNVAGLGGVAPVNGKRRDSRPTGTRPDLAIVSGALGNVTPPPPVGSPPKSAAKQAEIDAETRRLQAMVAEEERQIRERRVREEEEQTRRLLEREEQEQRRWKQAEVEAETERLRRQYGVQGAPRPHGSPPLPPRHNQSQALPSMSGALSAAGGGGWYGQPSGGGLQPPMPPRPHSVSPPGIYSQQPSYLPPPQPPKNDGRRPSNPSSPYAGPSGAVASVANFFGGSGNKRDDDKKKKVRKKLSVHF